MINELSVYYMLYFNYSDHCARVSRTGVERTFGLKVRNVTKLEYDILYIYFS